MNDILKLLELAVRLDLPNVVASIIDAVELLTDAAGKAKDTLESADLAELERIHAAALAANAELDAKLAAAEQKD